MPHRALEDREVALLAAALEASMDGMGILDAQGRLVYVNEPLAEMHGAGPEALTGEPWTTLYGAQEADRLQEAALPQLETDGRWQGPATGRRADGRPLPHTLSLSRTDQGQTVLVVRAQEDAPAPRPAPPDAQTLAEGEPGRALIATGAHLIVAFEPDGAVTLAQGNQLDTLGIDTARLLDGGLDQLRDAHPQLEPLIDESLRGHRIQEDVEIEDHVWRVQLTPIRDPVGAVQHVNMVAIDVTERHRARQRLRLVVENAPIALFALDPDGIITFAEGRALEGLGLTPDQLIGRSAEELDDDPDGFHDAMEALASGEEVRREATFQDRHYETIMDPVLDEEGELVQIIGVALDITDRKRTEEDLAATEQRFRAVFEASNDPIFLHDLDGRIETANARAAELLGYDRDELSSMHVNELYAEEEHDAASTALTTVLEDGHAQFETALLSADGSRIPAEISASQFEVGERTLVQGIARDIRERQRTEANLRVLVKELETSEAELRSLVDAIPDLVVVLDHEGHYVELPKEEHPLLPGEPGQLVGRPADTVLPPAFAEAVQDAIDQALIEDAQVQIEHELPIGDQTRAVEARFVPMPDGRVLMLARDITDRKEAEDGLERAHRRLLTFIDHLEEGIVVEDADRRILHANEGFMEAFALEQARGDLVQESFPTVLEGTVPLIEDSEDLLWLTQALPEQIQPSRGHEIELVDGRVLSLDYIPIDLDQAETAHLWRFLDVTQRARAEAERRAAQEQFEVAVGDLARSLGGAEDTEEIAQRLAHGARVVTSSEAALVLTPERTLAARSIASFDEETLDTLVRSNPDRFTWFDASLDTSAQPIDLLVLPGEGDELSESDARKVEILATQAAIAFHRADVTERIRQAHDRLERSARQKQMFLDILSHDLKNPLAVATGRIELLEMRHSGIEEELGPVKEALERADRLIERTLLYSRLEEQQALDRQPRRVGSLVDEVVANLRDTADEEEVELNVDGSAEATSRVHPVIVQALENLVGNAIKWNPAGGTVDIEIATRNSGHRIRVIDHGPGIPPEDRDRLFERFSRVDRTGTKGTGLGLAIAKRIVEMHDGRIWHEPTPGGGATFVIELPTSDESV